MNIRILLAAACIVLALSACVVEPYGGGYYGGAYRYEGGGYAQPSGYGRAVWRG
jgi:hypothetical protein